MFTIKLFPKFPSQSQIGHSFSSLCKIDSRQPSKTDASLTKAYLARVWNKRLMWYLLRYTGDKEHAMKVLVSPHDVGENTDQIG